jgi:hypothetical protein
MKQKIIFSLFVILITVSTLEAKIRGPIYTRNQVLNQYIFFHFYPQKAALSKKDVGLITDYSHSNIIRLREGLVYVAMSDMELSHLTLQPSYKISNRTELSINFGVLSYWNGFLDSGVHDFHKTFGLPDGQRKYKPTFDTEYYIGTRSWAIVDVNKPTSALRDTSVMLRQQLYKGKTFHMTVSAAVEFPTGSVKNGTSNGSLDYGVALYLDKSFLRNQLYFFSTTSYVKLGKYESEGHVMPTKSYKLHQAVALEFAPAFLKRHSLVVQLNYADTPYKKTNNEFYDIAPSNLITGLNLFKTKTSMWQFSFTEDMTHRTTPDFSLQLAYLTEF